MSSDHSVDLRGFVLNLRREKDGILTGTDLYQCSGRRAKMPPDLRFLLELLTGHYSNLPDLRFRGGNS
jgi:hypothetical protein